MNHTRLLNTYLVVAAIYLVGLIAFSESFNFTTKPLLLPWLLMAVYIFPTIRNRTWLFGALLFSWIGDILLLFVYKSQTFFIFGLVSFLIAHLAYILAFKNEIKGYHPKKSLPYFYIILIIGYLLAMWFVLIPTLGGMKIPVILYSIVITTMLAMSIYVDSILDSAASKWMILGAILFVLSDSILAFNKFHSPVPFASLAIMSTYLFAQFALVKGFLQKWS
ncbi:MAG: lysoplasmalogenase [Saprospiraceae bacterium]|nr:lysoplasmalogenase [Saprospiraceae bacterium]